MEKTVREVDCENLHRNQSAIRTETGHFILLILQQVGGVKEGGMHCNTIEESEECGRIYSRAHSPLWNESESVWSDNTKVKKNKMKEEKNPSASAYWTSNKTIKTVTLDIKKMVDKRELCHSSETWTSIYIFFVILLLHLHGVQTDMNGVQIVRPIIICVDHWVIKNHILLDNHKINEQNLSDWTNRVVHWTKDFGKHQKCQKLTKKNSSVCFSSNCCKSLLHMLKMLLVKLNFPS